MNDAIRMQLSAFVDGELPENEAEMLVRRMSQDVELRQEVAGEGEEERTQLSAKAAAGRALAVEIGTDDTPSDPGQDGKPRTRRPTPPRSAPPATTTPPVTPYKR